MGSTCNDWVIDVGGSACRWNFLLKELEKDCFGGVMGAVQDAEVLFDGGLLA